MKFIEWFKEWILEAEFLCEKDTTEVEARTKGLHVIGTCETCGLYDYDDGMCEKPECYEIFSDFDISTPPDFGCIHWENKKGTIQ